MINQPVLFLLFNRPDLAARVFETIRAAGPPRLYIAVDGWRDDKPGESHLVRECREFAGRVDWECEVHTLFRDRNLGCGEAVSSAISWFFENEESGIILEDDCLPCEGFFDFVSELLDHYKNQPEVMFIGGTNHQRGKVHSRYDYYFSRYEHVWGWGSWSRAWKHYDFDINSWRSARDESWLTKFFNGRKNVAGFWAAIFDKMKAHQIDTWDYQWRYSIWDAGGISIIPEVNLVSNIGFDPRATHTMDKDSENANCEVGTLSFPLRHPEEIRVCEDADIFHEKEYLPSHKSQIIKITRWLRQKFARFAAK